jgi:hypothetical protein
VPYHLLMFLIEIMRFPQRMTAMRACSCLTSVDRPNEMMK